MRRTSGKVVGTLRVPSGHQSLRENTSFQVAGRHTECACYSEGRHTERACYSEERHTECACYYFPNFDYGGLERAQQGRSSVPVGSDEKPTV
jgi:hypothetical protein